MRLPLRLLSKAEPVAAFALLLGLVVKLQLAGGAYASGFGGYPDEPAHLLVASEGEQWKLLGSYPQTQTGIVFANSLHVYAGRPVASLTVGGPTIRLDRLRALMVRTELR